MKNPMRGLIGAVALALPLVAAAAPVTFVVDFHITALGPSAAAWAPLSLGDTMHIEATFDSAAPFVRNPGGNPTIRDYDGSSVSFNISSGAYSATESYTSFGAVSSLIRVRDGAPDIDGFGDVVDGLSLQFARADGSQWALIMRDPADLISGGAIPTTQDARWQTARTAVFQICESPDSTTGQCSRLLSASNVPEPASIALSLAALAGLALSRRRQPR